MTQHKYNKHNSNLVRDSNLFHMNNKYGLNKVAIILGLGKGGGAIISKKKYFIKITCKNKNYIKRHIPQLKTLGK